MSIPTTKQKIMKQNLRSLVYNSRALFKSYISIRSLWMTIETCYLEIKYKTRGYFRCSYYNKKKCILSYNKRCEERLSYMSEKKGNLNIFWLGGSYDQDHSGTIQALKEEYNVYIFKYNDLTYGPIHTGIEIGRGKNQESIIKLNEAAVMQQIEKLSEKHIEINIVIGQLWGNIYSSKLIERLKTKKCIILNISMDDRLPNLWFKSNQSQRYGAVGLGGNVDMTLTSSPNCCEWYWQEGMNSMYFPLASSREFFEKSKYKTVTSRPIDVLFIGNNYGIRNSIIQYLVKNGINVECYGNGWPNGFANSELCAELYGEAKVVLGVGYVGLSKRITTLKLRDFDAIMSGALYITVYNRELSKFFKEGKEIEFYRNKTELLSKIKYYLTNQQELVRISEHGQQKAFERHTWSQRFGDIFKILHIPKRNE